jgi:UPF0716 protein FxsA
MPVFVLLLILPILEIFAGIEVAGQIGVAPTLLSLLALSIIGGWLLRYESTRAWRIFQEAVSTGRRPGRAASDSGLSVLGSVLLLVPGFVTAFFGVLCLVPLTRNALRGIAMRLLMGPARRRVRTVHVKSSRAHPVIDGELDK